MKKILILITLLCLIHKTQAQTTEQIRMAYYLIHKDSICPIFVKLIFQAKNKNGEILEEFAKRKLGKKYDEYFILVESKEPDMEKLKTLIQSPKFLRLLLGVNKQFFKDKYFRRSFTRTWNHTHSILNEIVCTRKEYELLFDKTLENNKYYFTLLMYPFIMQSFNID